jgi:hypothetical protein
MTPQEQQLVADLFDRLASLEGQRRDPDAERVIREGLARAPNAVYALVQSVLVQDEALKRANARIEELERVAGGAEPAQGGGGFLDSMRNVIMGQPRGSVPSVRPGGQGSSGVWGSRPEPSQPPPQAGYPQTGYPPGAPMGGGGSFLGTAAAAAAGMVGGSLLLGSIRSMMGGGGHQSFADSGALGDRSGNQKPWSDQSGSDLAKDAGINDVGSSSGRGDDNSGSRAGLFDSASNDDDDDMDHDSDGFDSDDGDSDNA